VLAISLLAIRVEAEVGGDVGEAVAAGEFREPAAEPCRSRFRVATSICPVPVIDPQRAESRAVATS
jgi:hypothetical protein